MYKKNKIATSGNQKMQYELERSLNYMIDRKMRKASNDLNSLIIGASNRIHNRNMSNFGLFKDADTFGASSGQTFSSLASVIQRNILRNL